MITTIDTPLLTGSTYYNTDIRYNQWASICTSPSKWCTTAADVISYSYDNGEIKKILDKTNIVLKESEKEKSKKNNKENSMIKITDVKVKNEKRVVVDETKRDENGNYKVTKIDVPAYTIVHFENGHVQTAYCDEGDKFNLEVGIGICVTRELMYRIYGLKGDDNTYNKIIRDGIKTYNKNCKKAKKIEEQKKAMIEYVEAKKAKEQKRRIKRAEKKKEREIEIMAEAIRRANADNK